MNRRFSRLPSFGLLSDEARRFELAAEIWSKLHGLAFELIECDVSEWNDRAANVLRTVDSLWENQSFKDAKIFLAPTFGNLLHTAALELRRICKERWEVEEGGVERLAKQLESLRLQELRAKALTLLRLCVDAIETCHFAALMRTVGEKLSAQNETTDLEIVRRDIAKLGGRFDGVVRAATEAADAAKDRKRERAVWADRVDFFKLLEARREPRGVTKGTLADTLQQAREDGLRGLNIGDKKIMEMFGKWRAWGGAKLDAETFRQKWLFYAERKGKKSW